MLADKVQIAGVIPHTGSMCLLDGVLAYDARRISCVSRTHLDQDNPLRTANGLPVLCGIEYAAQAMAMHGGMAAGAGGKLRAGYLVGVRDVVCAVPRLDTLMSSLTIEAELLMGNGASAMYQFSLSTEGSVILQGKATVVLYADKVLASP